MEQSEAIDKLAGALVLARKAPCSSCGGTTHRFPLETLLDVSRRGAMWWALPEMPGYLVSDCGKVVSTVGGRVRELKGSIAGWGYRYVFSGPNKRYIHQLVCETFNGPKPGPDYLVRHLNGDPLDNRAANLAWGTYAENAADTKAHGRSLTGEKNPQAVLTAADVREMRRLRETGETFKSIAQRFGVASMTAHRAVTGVTWNG